MVFDELATDKADIRESRVGMYVLIPRFLTQLIGLSWQ